MNSSSVCQSGQIVKLDHDQSCLYAEVIQVVTTRQVYWVRPLMLLEFSEDDYSSEVPLRENFYSQRLYNLRESSDLIWPLNLFQPALDTEVIPLLVELESIDDKNSNTEAIGGSCDATASIAHQQLRTFIHQVWQAYPDSFPQ